MIPQQLSMIGARLVGYPIALGCIGIGYGVFRTTRLALIQLIPGGEREHSLTSFCGGGIAGAALGGLRYQLGKMKLKKTERNAVDSIILNRSGADFFSVFL